MKLTFRKITLFMCCQFLVFGLFVSEASAVRIKDIASFSGVRNNQLVGYGLVVGLGGTGDTKDSTFTMTSMVNMMEKMGISVDIKTLKPKNVAAVMVTAKMPLSAKPGTPLDIEISSIGNATSLLGGTLLQTPLKGIDGKVYALAQTPVVLGGFNAEGAAARTQKNITTSAYIPGGAIVERDVPFDFNAQSNLTLSMNQADFSTTQNVVDSLNETMGGQYASATDAQTVKIEIPQEYNGNLVALLASVENIDISPQSVAKVVFDEKTGTIVIGREVRVGRVAIAHGNLRVTVQESANVSQPGPFTLAGQTVATPQTDVTATEQNNSLNMVEGATLQELVDGLNAIGATPRDLMSILKTLKTSGALYAELEIL